MAEIADDNLLQRCPRCEYSLQGLPIAHRCPECGVFFDRRWIVAAPSASTPAFFWKWRAPLGALISILCAAWIWAMLHTSNWAAVVPGSMFLAMGLMLLVTGIRAWRRPPGFIALSEEGLVVFRGGNAHELFSWLTIQAVQIDSGAYHLVLVLGNRVVRLPGRKFLHGSGPELTDCLGRIRIYHQQQQLRPPTT